MKKWKRLTAKCLIGMMLMTVMGGQKEIVASTPRATVWAEDNLTKVFQSTQVPKHYKQTVEIVSAKNEYRSGQVVITSGEEALANVSIAVSDLRTKDGAVIDKSNIEASFIDYIELKQHTTGLPWAERLLSPDGTLFYPDRITKDTTIEKIEKNTSRPIWYSVYTPADAEPGEYTGEITLTSQQGIFAVDVQVKVYDVVLPDSNESEYKVVHWLADWWNNFDTQQMFGVDMLSEEWWGVMENYAKYMKKIRNNTLFIDIHKTVTDYMSIGEEGEIVFDYTVFDRFIETFMNEGGVKYIHASSYFPWTSENSDNGQETFMIPSYSVVDGKIEKKYLNPKDENNEEWFEYFFSALREHLIEKGWLELFYQAGGSEPANNRDYEAVNWFYKTMDKYFPDIKTYGPTHVYRETPDIDKYVIKLDNYDNHTAYYEQEKLRGKEVMLYVCNLPAEGYMNRYYDTHLSKSLLPQWYTFKNDMVGYLHWGFNVWGGGDPAQTADFTWPGDSWVVYPDKAGKGLFSSMRAEVMLEGVQDNELLRMLADQGKKEIAMSIVGSVVKDGDEYTTNPEVIQKARIAILEHLTNEFENTVEEEQYDCLEKLYSYGKNIIVNTGINGGISIKPYETATFIDELDTLDKLYEYTTNIQLDQSNSERIKGDTSRATRASDTTESIVYQLEHMKDFKVTGYYQDKKNVIFYTSSDGENWSKLEVVEEENKLEQEWKQIEWIGSKLPDQTNFLKIELLKNNKRYYEPQIGQVLINYAKVEQTDYTKDNAIIYNGYPIREFTATIGYHERRAMEFYTSADARNWRRVEVEEKMGYKNGTYNELELVGRNLPQDAHYLKVVFANTNIDEQPVRLLKMKKIVGYGEYVIQEPIWENKSPFTVKEVLGNSVQLEWQPAQSQTSQVIKYHLIEGDKRVKSVDGQSNEVVLDNLKPYTEYTIGLIAEEEDGDLSVMKQVTFKTPGTGVLGESLVINKIVIIDKVGKELETCVTLSNLEDNKQEAVVIVMLADAEGEMHRINYEGISIEPKISYQETKLTLPIPDKVENFTVEIFVWDSLEQMNALVEPVFIAKR